MTEHEATRTLVKSPPELWAECSDASSLSRHLTQFGEIRITRLEPEDTVAWEGTLASGTVRLEPSGWGTRVIMTARQTETAPVVAEPEVVAEPVAVASQPIASEPIASEPVASEPVQPSAPRRGRRFSRLWGLFGGSSPEPVASVPEPHVELPVPVEPTLAQPTPVEPAPIDPVPVLAAEVPADIDPTAVLSAALDSLGQAHRRPFSRG